MGSFFKLRYLSLSDLEMTINPFHFMTKLFYFESGCIDEKLKFPKHFLLHISRSDTLGKTLDM